MKPGHPEQIISPAVVVVVVVPHQKQEYLTIISTPGQVEQWPTILSEWIRLATRNSYPAFHTYPPSSNPHL